MMHRLFWISFLIAVCLRAGMGTALLLRAENPDRLEFPDERQYWDMAGSLREGHGLRDELGFRAARMPLYPALLSPFTAFSHGVVMAKVFQWMIGSLSAALAAVMMARAFGGRAGWLAGLLVALDPFQVFFSSLLLTETVSIMLLSLLWFLAMPIVRGVSRPTSAAPEFDAPVSTIRWLAIGVTGGASVLLRESTLGLLVALFVATIFVRRLDRRIISGTMVSGCILVLMLAPWAIRNRLLLGEWCWLTTRAGISLYDGVGPQASGASDLGEVKQMPAVLGLSETEWNRFFLTKSYESMQNDGSRLARLAVIKFVRMWNPVPNAAEYRSPLVRAVSAAWSLPIFALALIGVILLPRNVTKSGGGCDPNSERGACIERNENLIEGRRAGRRIALFLLLPALYFSALHVVFVGSVRYRLPAMPMIDALAGLSLARWIDARREKTAIDERTGNIR